MSTLKMKTETFHTVDYNDLEDCIRSVTGHEYEILPMEECSNDTSKTYSVKKFNDTEYTQKYEVPEWETFKTTGEIGQWRLGLILDGLAHEGHIPEGKYIINMSW